MIYPDLNASLSERRSVDQIGIELSSIVYKAIHRYTGLKTQVKVSGSTQKETALPKKLFGTDIDIAVMANQSLVDAITYPSDEFEGCQIFSLNFFNYFNSKIDELYYAGHRISGKYRGINFDCAIADTAKDSWKWDYNDSEYLPKTALYLKEVKKLKFIAKTFNISGSEVNGVVGPAAELAIYENGNAENVLQVISEMQEMNECNLSFLTAQPFPSEYYKLFGPVNDYIKEGLINSFRLTTPSVYNRMIRVARNRPNTLQEYIKFQDPEEICKASSAINVRLLSLIISTHMKTASKPVDILRDSDGFLILTTSKDKSIVKAAIKEAKSIEHAKHLNHADLSPLTKKHIQSVVGDEDLSKFIFFIGTPISTNSRIPIPFDFLTRPNCKELLRLMEKYRDC